MRKLIGAIEIEMIKQWSMEQQRWLVCVIFVFAFCTVNRNIV